MKVIQQSNESHAQITLKHFCVMIFVVLLSLSLFGSVRTGNVETCTHPATLQPQRTATNHSSAEADRRIFKSSGGRDAFQKYTSAGQKSSLGLHEAVCYNYTESSKGWTKFLIELVKMEEVYPIVESYDFSIPKVETRCWCDCPGGRDYCNSGKHECQEPCVSWFKDDQTVDGCSITLGRSQLCCTAELDGMAGPEIPQLLPNQTHFTAVKLGIPSLVATISQKGYNYTDGTSVELFSDIRQVKLEKHHLLEEKLRIVLHLDMGSVSHKILENAWYFMVPGHPIPKLYTGCDINGKDEWDVEKLGWFRPNGTGYEFDKSRLASAISGEVKSCGDQRLDNFQFDALYTNEFPGDAYDLKEDWEREGEYEIKDNSVVIERTVSERIEVTMTLKDNQDIILPAGNSSVQNFDAEITVSQDGLVYLTITLYEAEGTLEGRYYSDNSSTSDGESRGFTIFIPDGPQNGLKKQVRLVRRCAGFSAQVCLRPWSLDIGKYKFICRTAYCETEPETYRPNPSAIKSFLPVKLESWYKLFSPGEWFNGINSTLELVLMLAVLFGIFLFIFTVLKLGLKLMGGR